MRQLKIRTTPTFRVNESISKYLTEVSKIPTLTVNEEVELTQQIKRGGPEAEEAKERMIKANLRFVVSVAKQYQNNGLPLIDLIEEGNIGLIRAVEKFDDTRGFKFISYAVWWIRQSILQAISEKSNTIHLPFNQVSNLNKIRNVSEKFEKEHYRKPSISELIDLTNLEEKVINKVLTAYKYPVSMDSPAPENDKMTVGDMIAGIERTDYNLDLDSLNFDLNALLEEILTEKEYKIITRAFGIGCRPLTHAEIGYELNLSRERVRQIKEYGLKKIRKSSKIDILRKYLL